MNHVDMFAHVCGTLHLRLFIRVLERRFLTVYAQAVVRHRLARNQAELPKAPPTSGPPPLDKKLVRPQLNTRPSWVFGGLLRRVHRVATLRSVDSDVCDAEPRHTAHRHYHVCGDINREYHGPSLSMMEPPLGLGWNFQPEVARLPLHNFKLLNLCRPC
jgi:hypothetical protein